jgi:hypothetical protein
MAKEVLNHIKFTPGRWFGVDYAGHINIQNGPMYEDADILTYAQRIAGLKSVIKEEAEANQKLIEAAPKMFWYLVTTAEETGQQYLYDMLSGIIGHKIEYEEMYELAEHGHRILQEWHKEEQAEKEAKK